MAFFCQNEPNFLAGGGFAKRSQWLLAVLGGVEGVGETRSVKRARQGHKVLGADFVRPHQAHADVIVMVVD